MWFTSPLIGPVAVAVVDAAAAAAATAVVSFALDPLICCFVACLHMKWFYEISSQMISWKRHFVGVGAKWRRTQIGHSIIKFVSHKSSIPTSESCKQDWMKIDWIWLSFLLEICVCVVVYTRIMRMHVRTLHQMCFFSSTRASVSLRFLFSYSLNLSISLPLNSCHFRYCFQFALCDQFMW